MEPNENHYIVFTDMDGTLLDHHDYSYAAAKPLLQKLRQYQIPVIANTSKTFAEMKVLCQELTPDMPFIVENGAAIYIPETFIQRVSDNDNSLLQHLTRVENYYCKTLVEKKEKWVTLLANLSAETAEGHTRQKLFEHYSVINIERLQQLTGLNKEKAGQSKQREFSEPVVWHGNDAEKKTFMAKLRSHGASPVEGGRFIHVMGKTSKGDALHWFINFYKQLNPQTKNIVSIALGDSHNDIAMLEDADIAVRILSPVHAPPSLNKSNNVYTSTLPGPRGWNEMLNKIIFKT